MQSALSPLALIKKVVPLITDEAPYGIPDHDLMIEGTLMTLPLEWKPPKLEATERRRGRALL